MSVQLPARMTPARRFSKWDAVEWLQSSRHLPHGLGCQDLGRSSLSGLYATSIEYDVALGWRAACKVVTRPTGHQSYLSLSVTGDPIDMHEIRQMIGVCPQQDVLFDLLAAKEYTIFK
ncbi:hypothetical protein EVAR_47693_1 [Eumeta japonica]|uniref:Uncharacterized protein n=1 Tax=Eumeta variegata TaxID=151549 RepID=A0A4C1XR09_EUMVA|nr:hypothetical protein EVAR_47693_1 [Eumeta japonica]